MKHLKNAMDFHIVAWSCLIFESMNTNYILQVSLNCEIRMLGINQSS